MSFAEASCPSKSRWVAMLQVALRLPYRKEFELEASPHCYGFTINLFVIMTVYFYCKHCRESGKASVGFSGRPDRLKDHLLNGTIFSPFLSTKDAKDTNDPRVNVMLGTMAPASKQRRLEVSSCKVWSLKASSREFKPTYMLSLWDFLTFIWIKTYSSVQWVQLNK